MAHPQAAVPHIRAVGRGGSVIITSSGAALMPPGIGHYNASTAGVVALARTLAQEVGLEPDPRQLRQPRQRGHADDR
jgi:NAD(P)-dependent dehydrogenase (short-subunit alcohol dehydrogenase family)